MIRSLYSGASGMTAQQKNIDTIANNIANINTAGYKKNRVQFKDSLYSAMANPENPNETLLVGSGVLVGKTSKVYTESSYKETDNALDLSILGEGFFAVEDQNGVINFTRDGSFNVSEYDEELYLVNSDGNFVLDDNMDRIILEGNVSDISINTNGEITGADAKICVVSFANADGLISAGSNLYTQSDASGDYFHIEQPEIKQRMLECSNVSVAEEMTELIRAQRAYQIASKAVTTADEMESLANNLRV